MAEKTKKTFKEKWQDFVKQGQADENDPNLVMSTGSGASIVTDDKKESLPEGSSSGTDTIPLSEGEQEQIDTSNDATRQIKAQIKETAKEIRKDAEENDLGDIAKKAMEKYGFNTANINTNYTAGLPRSIWKAWKDGRFDPSGLSSTKDAKSIRNYLMMNEFATALENMGAGIKNGEKKEGLWTASVRKNMEEADNRNNDKFKTDMNNQMQQLNIGAEDQIELNKHINEIMADTTMAAAAKHANNIEDTIGLWHLKQALGESWGKLPKDKQRDVLVAINAMNNGDIPSAQALLYTTLGPEGYVDMQKKAADYTLKLNKANADKATTDASYAGINNAMNIVNGVAGLAGNVAKLIP